MKGRKYPEYNDISNEELMKEHKRLIMSDNPDKDRLEYVERLTEDMRDSDLFWGALEKETKFNGEDENMTDLVNDEIKNKTSVYEEYKETAKLFSDKLDLEEDCGDPRFIKWLMDKKSFKVKWTFWGGETDYDFEFTGVNGERMIISTIENPDYTACVRDIRGHYDTWVVENLKRSLKKAGIVVSVGASLLSLVLGLSLGLKRKGHDLVRDSKKPWSPNHQVAPWIGIERASGEGLIVMGNNIYLVIGGVCVGVYIYRKKRAIINGNGRNAGKIPRV